MRDDKISTITVKMEMTRVKDELNTQFQERLFNSGTIFSNINYRELRRNLKQNKCLLHVDFSENYSCKYSKKKSRRCILAAHTSRPLCI